MVERGRGRNLRPVEEVVSIRDVVVEGTEGVVGMHLPTITGFFLSIGDRSVKRWAEKEKELPHQGAALSEPQARRSSQTTSRT
jgi:hypothetical protein